jgi:N-acetylmuramoyl-L-alanine amidase
MTAQRQTRRPFAVVVAGVTLAGGLVMAQPALPTIVPGPVGVVARAVSVPLARERVVELPLAATDVALHWPGAPDAVVTIALAHDAGAAAAGDFSEEIVLDRDEDGPDVGDGGNAGSGEAGGADETYSDVIWSAGARFVRVTSDRPLDRVTVVAFASDGAPRPVVGGGPVAVAALNEPAIITRAGWGADESLRFDAAGHERWPPSYAPLQKLVVHHTAGRNGDPNPAATIRSIYYFHAITRGWGDIGYNFLIDEAGRIYEGRHARNYAAGEPVTSEDLAGRPARGAHALGYNEGTVGIALLGTFDTQLPTTAARAALERLLAWEAERHGINPKGSSQYTNPIQGTSKYLPNIFGHRDVNATDCPGDAFYATLPTLRTNVANRIAAATGAAVDSVAPAVSSFRTLATTPTGGSSISFGLIFKEPVTGLTAGSFQVGGTSPGWSVTGLSGRASTWLVTASAVAPVEGSIELTLPAGAVLDLAGHAGPAAPVVATAQFAVDTTPPSVSIYATPSWSATRATSFDVTVTFSEPVADLTAADVAIGGTSDAATPWTVHTMVGSGAHYGFTVDNANPANGSLTMGIPSGITADPAGNANLASAVHTVIVDRAAPTVGAPLARLRTGISLGTTVPVRMTWPAADTGGSGLKSFDLARSVDGGGFSIVASAVPTASVSQFLSTAHSYRYEVRARDRAGNVSSWAVGPTVHASLLQQSSTAINYHGGWTTASNANYSGGSVRYATAGGASASLTTSARSLAFVTTLAAGRGAIRVYVDGALKATIDLYSATARYRYVVFAQTWTTLGTHTMTIVVQGTVGRPRVDVDAFEVVR